MNRPAMIVGLGEVLWDVFPSGPRFGGAPANFVCSASGLGRDRFRVFMVSGVGQDDLGKLALQSLSERNVATTWTQQNDKPTGEVLVSLDSDGVASYEFAEDAAWDNIEWNKELEQLASATDVVCFGTLGQRRVKSRDTIQRFVAATQPTVLRIFDINLRPPFYSDTVILDSLELANVLKLNDDELPVLASLCGFSGTDVEVLQQIAKKFSLSAVALTRGAHGAVLLRGATVSECVGFEAAVVDTVGAGDAFTAAFTIGLLDELDLDVINRWACRVAAYVCSQGGATPVLPSALAMEAE